jgi:hypothetical protein
MGTKEIVRGWIGNTANLDTVIDFAKKFLARWKKVVLLWSTSKSETLKTKSDKMRCYFGRKR